MYVCMIGCTIPTISLEGSMIDNISRIELSGCKCKIEWGGGMKGKVSSRNEALVYPGEGANFQGMRVGSIKASCLNWERKDSEDLEVEQLKKEGMNN